MRLTKQTNYAFRILMYCAANGGQLSRVAEIAKAYTVSEPFLFKILQPLTEGGLIETVRGRNGGIRLARPAAAPSRWTDASPANARISKPSSTTCCCSIARATTPAARANWSWPTV